MQVGDLVRAKYTDKVGVIARIESVANFYKSITRPTVWVFLLGDSIPLKASSLEVFNASR